MQWKVTTTASVNTISIGEISAMGGERGTILIAMYRVLNILCFLDVLHWFTGHDPVRFDLLNLLISSDVCWLPVRCRWNIVSII